MKKLLFSLLSFLFLMGSFSGKVIAAPNEPNPATLKDLAAVRQATAKYHDVNAALADGYIRTPSCIQEEGIGGMGIHFVNPARIQNPALNILEPEILLYVETSDGMVLIGVEYMLAIGRPNAPVPNPAPPAPHLFGQTFNGPMAGHEPGQPPHYDLHVWVWWANPAGMFAQYNPNVNCQ